MRAFQQIMLVNQASKSVSFEVFSLPNGGSLCGIWLITAIRFENLAQINFSVGDYSLREFFINS